MYIYSLGHFLTTKGALIDGDGYPPKNPKNDLKKVTKMTKIHSKLTSKIDQKSCFLMAKSSFSSKLIKLQQKWVKKWQKLINISHSKMRSNLTTKRGDSGSAGSLGQKCVMNQAPNLDTKMIKKWCQQLKMTKNDQNSQIDKNMKIEKMQKPEKVTKSENAKSVKVRKS